MKPDDFGGCLKLNDDVVSYAEFDWYGPDELTDGRYKLGLRGGCQVILCKPINGELCA